MTQPHIVALGEPMIAFNQARGSNQYLQGFGGDTSNVAIAAARQGATVGYLTILGQDVFGDMFMDLWQKEKVDASQVKRSLTAYTAIYFVTHTEAGHQFTYLRAGSAAATMSPLDLPEQYIANAKCLHVSGISQAIGASACDAVFAAMAMARRNGVKISYDTNLRQRLWGMERARAVIERSIALADVCLPGMEDMTTLTGRDNPDDVLNYLRALGAKVCVLKIGAAGCITDDGTTRTKIPGHRVDFLDATGAGDSFDGSFIARMTAGDSLIDAARYANVAAALSTTGYGAITPIPDRSAVLSALAISP